MLPDHARSSETRQSDLYVRQLVMRAVRESAREVDFIASTEAIDSYGDIVLQNWDLKRFLSNPVILWCHSSWDLPIGQATRIEVVNNQLECTIRFASEKANPQAEQVWQGILERSIRAVSVGFWPREIRYERRDDVDVCVLDDNELREISVVSIPANPEALAKAKAKALADYQAKQTPPPAERGGNSKKETTMDPKDQEIAALKSKLAEANAEIATLKANAITEKASSDASHKAALDKAAVEMSTKVAALELQNAHLVTERDTEKAARAVAEGQVIEIEVGSLVGKKITAAEKEAFVELRKSNKAIFDKLIAQRGDMPHTTQIIPAEKNGEPPPPVDPAATKMDADFDKFMKSVDEDDEDDAAA